VAANYRVRSQIRDSLEKKYFRNQNPAIAAYIAFSVAFDYQIGFGAKLDKNKCHMWLQRSGKCLEDLKVEKEAVRPIFWKSWRMRSFSGIVPVNLIHEYRAWEFHKLVQARKQYEREIGYMTQEFKEFDFIPLPVVGPRKGSLSHVLCLVAYHSTATHLNPP
jgi:hypothetical protein